MSGTCHLFVSVSESNPGPLTAFTKGNTTSGISRRTVTITLSGNPRVCQIYLIIYMIVNVGGAMLNIAHSLVNNSLYFPLSLSKSMNSCHIPEYFRKILPISLEYFL